MLLRCDIAMQRKSVYKQCKVVLLTSRKEIRLTGRSELNGAISQKAQGHNAPIAAAKNETLKNEIWAERAGRAPVGPSNIDKRQIRDGLRRCGFACARRRAFEE